MPPRLQNCRLRRKTLPSCTICAADDKSDLPKKDITLAASPGDLAHTRLRQRRFAAVAGTHGPARRLATAGTAPHARRRGILGKMRSVRSGCGADGGKRAERRARFPGRCCLLSADNIGRNASGPAHAISTLGKRSTLSADNTPSQPRHSTVGDENTRQTIPKSHRKQAANCNVASCRHRRGPRQNRSSSASRVGSQSARRRGKCLSARVAHLAKPFSAPAPTVGPTTWRSRYGTATACRPGSDNFHSCLSRSNAEHNRARSTREWRPNDSDPNVGLLSADNIQHHAVGPRREQLSRSPRFVIGRCSRRIPRPPERRESAVPLGQGTTLGKRSEKILECSSSISRFPA